MTLPLLRPAIASAASVVFLFTFTSFGVILLLGGAQFATLEVEIYRQTAELLDLRTAAVLSLLQMTALVVLLFAYSRYQQRNAIQQRPLTRGAVARRPRTRGERAIVVGQSRCVMAVVLGVPLVVLVERSLAGPTATVSRTLPGAVQRRPRDRRCSCRRSRQCRTRSSSP